MISLLSTAQTTRKYSNEFLNIGVDAAALGMSNAVSSHTSDVNAGYWNPAGLVNLEDNQLALFHSSYFANIANYNYIAFAKPLDDKSAVGFSLIRFGVDDILDTTQLIDDQGNINYDRVSLFSTADYALTFSYARRLPLDGFSYGVNAKVVRRIIGDFASSWGFGLDAGIQFQSKNDWKFGIMARDITTTFNAWSFDDEKLADIQNAVEGQNQTVPESTELTLPKLQIGLSKKFVFHYDYSLLTSFDLNVRFAETNDIISTSVASINPALGFEFGYTDLVFLRAGAGNFQNELQLDNTESLSFQPSLGLGFKYRGIQIDYAFTDIGDQSAALYSNVFSLKLDFSIFR
ncbi:PorV/PorQ family protein [Subsaximicrobium wynnwilliamsii]|uniref:PorV/PorQ family protein n=1 Tax=Subsaximicrobium wynnwilliamsii TaxID=291179 RepID=A0A5C6ZD81_9FLAO|nr:PorV/PorQ family protein [Subsaximicrobium wynnwilliamsii]TXD81719.1 PorV/PorQ family protein [Subsaximicrobium wynnwilliamsii]TXD87474.1 PorV/PorQ family protein [Subsaximicrobium wynnwilliamsii]TXE01162.1 PorV/PorQ family protein [Subsaximicrobium wynnwilliamsii]